MIVKCHLLNWINLRKIALKISMLALQNSYQCKPYSSSTAWMMSILKKCSLTPRSNHSWESRQQSRRRINSRGFKNSSRRKPKKIMFPYTKGKDRQAMVTIKVIITVIILGLFVTCIKSLFARVVIHHCMAIKEPALLSFPSSKCLPLRSQVLSSHLWTVKDRS